MSEILNALREKFASPADALRALGLDEALLETKPKGKQMDEKPFDAASFVARLRPLLAQDANIEDLFDLIDALKGANEEQSTDIPLEEKKDKLMDLNKLDENEEKDKAKDDMEMMDDPTEDNDQGEKMEKVAMIMKLIKELVGASEEPEARPALDNEMPFLEKDDKKEEKKEPAMDAAAIVKAVEKRVLQNAREIRKAENEVRPYVGDLAMDARSAEDVYRKAASMMNIEGASTIHHSALPALIKLYGNKPAETRQTAHAMDSAASSEGFASRYADAAKIRILS